MTPDRVDELPDPTRPGHWVLPHWDGDRIRAGLTDGRHDLHLRDRPAADVTAAFDALRAAIPGMTGVVVSPQVHGRGLHIHDRLPQPVTVAPEADGHLTRTAGILVTVTVADCVPVFVRHARSGWVGVLHAGWRGAAQRILRAAVELLGRSGVTPETIAIHCGVSICGACYEVGPEVHEAVGQPRPSGPAPLDLRSVIATQAAALGVRSITVSGLCAREHRAFHSHRGSKGGPGRMAAYVGRPST